MLQTECNCLWLFALNVFNIKFILRLISDELVSLLWVMKIHFTLHFQLCGRSKLSPYWKDPASDDVERLWPHVTSSSVCVCVFNCDVVITCSLGVGVYFISFLFCYHSFSLVSICIIRNCVLEQNLINYLSSDIYLKCCHINVLSHHSML